MYSKKLFWKMKHDLIKMLNAKKVEMIMIINKWSYKIFLPLSFTACNLLPFSLIFKRDLELSKSFDITDLLCWLPWWLR